MASVPAPKDTNAIEGSAGPLEPVFNSAGVMDTAVRKSPEPIQISTPHRLQEQPLQEEFVPAQPTEEELQEERILQSQSDRVGDLSQGQFLAKDPLELEQSRRGSASSVVQSSFAGSFLGAMMNTDRITKAQKDQLEMEVANYSGDNPWTAMGVGMASTFAGNAPIDLGIALSTGGLGAMASAISTTARYGKSIHKTAMAINKLREASRTGTLTQKIAVNGAQDALEGFAGGALSEVARMHLGRGADLESSIEMGLNDAAVGSVFGFALRGLSATAKHAFIKKVTEDVVDDIAPDGEAVQNATTKASSGADEVDLEELGVDEETANVVEDAIEEINASPSERQAKVEKIDTPATKKRTADSIQARSQKFIDDEIDKPLTAREQAIEDEWERQRLITEGLPDHDLPPISPLRELRGALEKLDRGEITEDELIEKAVKLHGKLEEKNARKVVKGTPDRIRGYDRAREKLIEAMRREDISREAGDIGLWLLEKNPALADDLSISVRAARRGEEGTGGIYTPVNRVVTLLKNKSGDEAVAHEIMHHTEKMLPAKFRKAIRKEYLKNAFAYRKRALKRVRQEGPSRGEDLTPAQRELAFINKAIEGSMGSSKARDDAFDLLPSSDLYQLTNVSEFFAVNAGKILSKRFGAQGSVFKRLTNWLKEFVQKLRKTIGLKSDAPVIRGINRMLDAKRTDGGFVSDAMLAEVKDQRFGDEGSEAVFRSIDGDVDPSDDLLEAARDAADAPEGTPGRFQYEDLPQYAGADRTGSNLQELKGIARDVAQSDIVETPAQTKVRVDQERMDMLVAEKQQEQIDLRDDAISDDPTKNIAGGTLAPRTKLAQSVINMFNKSQMLFWDNFDITSLSRMLGGTFNKVADKAVTAANISGELLTTMRSTYDEGMAKVSLATRRKMTESTDQTFEVRVRNPDGTESVTTKTISLTGNERVKLTELAMDGLDEDAGTYTSHAGGSNLAFLPEIGDKETGGFLTQSGEVIVLTKDQRKSIAEGDLLSEDEQQIVTAMQDAYRSIVGRANEISRSLVGRDVFDTDNYFYSPKRTVDSKDALTDEETMFDRMFDPRDAAARGAVMGRTGFSTLRLNNPFDEIEMYMNSMSHNLGHVDFHLSMDNLLSGRSMIELETKVSKGVVNTMKKLLEVSKGNRKGLGKPRQGFISKMFTLRQLGILSVNPSAALKQLGSGASAVATGRIDWSTAKISSEIVKMVGNKKLREETLADLADRVPSYAGRQVHTSHMLDVDELINSGSAHMTAGKELTIGDITRMAKDQDISLSNATIELLDKGMVMIKKLDDSTMASVWNATKDKIAREVKKGNIDPAAAADEEVKLFTTLMMESQPTRSPTTLSINQQSGGFVSRALTQFSTQTRHNANLAFRATMEYINNPNKTKGDWVDMMSKLMPLAYQTIYTTLAGAGATGGVAIAANTLSSDKAQRTKRAQERRYKRTNSAAKEWFTKFVSSGLTQVPVSGQLLNQAFQGAMGQPVYSTQIPMLQEFAGIWMGMSDIQQGKAEQGLLKMQKEMFRLVGVPGTANKFIIAAQK